jgi:hypothetical protein
MDGWNRKRGFGVLVIAFLVVAGCGQQNQRQGLDRDAERMRIAVNDFLVEARIATTHIASRRVPPEADLLRRKFLAIPSQEPGERFYELHMRCVDVMSGSHRISGALSMINTNGRDKFILELNAKGEKQLEEVAKKAFPYLRALESEMRKHGF